MKNQFNALALKFLSSVYIPSNPKAKDSTNLISDLFVSIFNSELSTLGFSLSKEALIKTQSLSMLDFSILRFETITFLQEVMGLNSSTTPLFKDFPYSEDYSEDQYITKFKRHYSIHTSLSQKTTPKELSYATDTEIFNLFKKLVNSKTNLSEDFKSFIKTVLLVEGAAIKGLLPREIEIKENAAFISSLLVDVKKSDKYIKSYNKTATDVLRFAVACSGGDISLAEKTTFKLSRKESKMVMSLLNEINNPLEDLKRHSSAWLVLSKLLHVGAFKSNYPKAFLAIDTLRNNIKSIKTFDSFVEELSLLITQDSESSILKNQENLNFVKELSHLVKTSKEVSYSRDELCLKLAKLVSARAGVFGRKMDFLLRNSSMEVQCQIIDLFINVIGDASNNILLSLKKFIDNRNTLEMRVFMPKGNALKAIKGSNPEGKVGEFNIIKLSNAIEVELYNRFMKKEHFKNVYISPEINNVIIPFAMRSNSDGAPEMTRGSKFKLKDDTNVIRMFIQWHNVKDALGNYDESNDCSYGGNRVDLDLSASIYDEKFQLVEQIYYGSYGNNDGRCYFSGDETNAPGEAGAFEAIDINIDKFDLKKSRYVMMSIKSYTDQPFSSFEASAGIMERTYVGGGEVFEPKTVSNRFSLNGSNNSGIPIIFDLKTRELIWVDIQNEQLRSYGVNNIANDKFSLQDSLKMFTNFGQFKTTLFELVELHKGRFENVDYVKVPNKEYDLELDMNFAKNLPEVVSNWL